MKRLIVVCVLCCIMLLASSCCTVKGIARDMAWTADKIDNAIVVPD